MSVFVILEVRNGKITRSSWEAAAAAATLANGAPVTAVLLGANTEALAAQAAAGPVARVLRVEHPLLGAYSSDGYVIALHQLLQTETPAYAVLPHTYQVRDFAPRLATRFGQVLISDVIALEPGPTFVRQLFQGRMNGIYQPASSGHLLRLRSGRRFPRSNTFATASSRSRNLRPRNRPHRHPHNRKRTIPRHIPDRRSIIRAAYRQRRPRHQGRRQHAYRAGACGGLRRRARRLASHLRLGMAAHGAPGGQLRADSRPQTLPRHWDLRRDSALGRHQGIAVHRRDQQRPQCAHL